MTIEMEKTVRKALCVAVAAIAILWRSPLVADDLPSSRELLQSCIANTQYCYAQILVDWKGNENLKAAGICSFELPADVQLPALRDIVIKYLQEHPEFGDANPSSTVNTALSLVYPCNDVGN
jgi:hypothetical protein